MRSATVKGFLDLLSGVCCNFEFVGCQVISYTKFRAAMSVVAAVVAADKLVGSSGG